MEEPGVDTYDNDFDEDEGIAPGSSIFGDDANDDDSSEIGDGDYAEPPPVGERPGASVFDTPDVGETVQQSVFGDDPAARGSMQPDDASALDTDPWANAPAPGDDWETSGDDTVALNVEPGESDDLDAWSVLGSSTPNWGDDPEAGQDWDPGPAPDPSEPETVRIGETSERFFTYEDGGIDGGFVDDGFVVDEAGDGGDMSSRVITGAALLVLALVALAVGPLLALALIVVVCALAAGEFYNAVRVAGYQPATLLGLTASVALPLAVYWRGLDAVPLILGLSVVFGLLWFLLGISTDTPVMNLGVTLLGVMYVGLLGSFGAALLELGGEDEGIGLLLAAIIVTIAYDVGAFFAGRSMGRTPLTAVSPNKTVEGLAGGAIASLVTALVLFGMLKIVEPFDSRGTWDGYVLLGVLGAIMAPLGDLAESLIKRDLGIKDMGSILPGHGGFLDRFDALLFVLPAVYYMALYVFY